MPDQFRTIDVPTGLFISWGKLGQQVTLRVVSFDPTGGRDVNDKVCPQLIGTLTEACDNYREHGTVHERVAEGEMVTVNAAVANLKKGLLICDPKKGDLVRLTFADTYKTAKGDGKVIKVEHAPAPAGVSEEDL
jgi:hypothetical protein